MMLYRGEGQGRSGGSQAESGEAVKTDRDPFPGEGRERRSLSGREEGAAISLQERGGSWGL
jgi:hypothetical protein